VEEGAAHSEVQGRRDKLALGEGTLLFRERERQMDRGEQMMVEGATEDLTWGYKMPQGQLLILEIRQVPRRGA